MIFAAFLAVTLPMITIPVDIGEHSYTGGIYDADTGEQMEAVAITLSGKRIYSLDPGPDSPDFEGRIVVGAETFQRDSQLIVLPGLSQGGWTYGKGLFGPGVGSWNGYTNFDFPYPKSYSALVVELSKTAARSISLPWRRKRTRRPRRL